MLKKMRWRFIFSAMSAITAVMIVLVLCINSWNYSVTIDRINLTIADLMDSEQRRHPPESRKNHPPGDFFGKTSPETPYMTRYFSVHFDEDGNIFRSVRILFLPYRNRRQWNIQLQF